MTWIIKRLRIIGAAIVLIMLAVAAFFYWPHSLPDVVASASQPSGAQLIERGRYLAIAADCEACHTAPGGKPFAGGFAFDLPFGKLYTPNITPDADTGIGGWTAAEFVRAVRSGIGKHGEDLYPAFPYTSYALLSSDDILAIKAYMDSLAPVANRVPANDLVFPFNQRNVMRAWKLLFVPGRQFQPDPAKSDQWNKGAYLVEALGHCGECHTPRGLMFQRKEGSALAGGVLEGWTAWNITSDKQTGIGRWTDVQLADYLSHGYADGVGPAAGPMRVAIDLSLSQLPRSDIDAMVAYLRTVPAKPSSYEDDGVRNQPPAKSSQPWASTENQGGLGRQIFEGACASCHGYDGSGQNTARAALLGSHSVNDPTGTNLLRVILQGTTDPAKSPTTMMPAFAAAYSDTEIAALSNYVIAHFGGRPGRVTPNDVARAR